MIIPSPQAGIGAKVAYSLDAENGVRVSQERYGFSVIRARNNPV